MKKNLAFTMSIILVLTLCSLALGEAKGTPEDTYNELVQLLGNPSDSELTRTEFANTSEYLGHDGLHILQARNTQTGVLIIYNRPDTPETGSFWQISNPREREYKALFTFVHEHGKNQSITEDNRCTYVNFEDKQLFIYRTGEKKYPKESHDLDEYLSSIIALYYPNLANWYAKTF